MGAITSRLEESDEVYRVEVPQEFVKKLNWRKGQILTLVLDGEKLQVEKMQGFYGA